VSLEELDAAIALELAASAAARRLALEGELARQREWEAQLRLRADAEAEADAEARQAYEGSRWTTRAPMPAPAPAPALAPASYDELEAIDPVPGMRAVLQAASALLAGAAGGAVLRASSFDTLRALLSACDVEGAGRVSTLEFARALERWLPGLGSRKAQRLVEAMGLLDDGRDEGSDVEWLDFVDALEALAAADGLSEH